MSSTRHAKQGSPLNQSRYASSPEFEKGLLANLVAKRCSVLDAAEDRELIWAIQSFSHREGGLKKLVEDLLAMFPEKIGTRSMHAFGIGAKQIYNAEQVKEIRSHLPGDSYSQFPLRGEVLCGFLEQFVNLAALPGSTAARVSENEIKASKVHPASYPAGDFIKICTDSKGDLETDLKNICLNPAVKLESFSAFYFCDLIDCLRNYFASHVAKLKSETVVTEIGRQVSDSLDYASQSRCMVLIEGLARIGKTFSAQAWCEQHPGTARYVQTPSTNDDSGFFRAIAKAIGIACGAGTKAVDLRERIEDVLQGGDLTVIFDEAHYIFPTVNCRYALPGRINWIMTALVNKGVPVALVTTPQFIETQKAVERRTNWASEQFIGRIGHYQKLPDSLTAEDLAEVARKFVPEGDEKSIETLVVYAQGSAKYLAAIECVVRRARYLATKAGRDEIGFKHIRDAITESVIPSDSALSAALSAPDKTSRRRALATAQGAFQRPLTKAEKPLQPGDKRQVFQQPISRGNLVSQSDPGALRRREESREAVLA